MSHEGTKVTNRPAFGQALCLGALVVESEP